MNLTRTEKILGIGSILVLSSFLILSQLKKKSTKPNENQDLPSEGDEILEDNEGILNDGGGVRGGDVRGGDNLLDEPLRNDVLNGGSGILDQPIHNLAEQNTQLNQYAYNDKEAMLIQEQSGKSYILTSQPEDIGDTLLNEGFAKVDDVIKRNFASSFNTSNFK